MSISSFEIHFKPSIIYGENHYDVLKMPVTLYTVDSRDTSSILIPVPRFIDQLLSSKQIKKHHDDMKGLDYIELDDLNDVCSKLLESRDEYLKLSVKDDLLRIIDKKIDKVLENQCSGEATAFENTKDKNEGPDYETLATEVWEEYDDIQFFMNSLIGYVRYGYFLLQSQGKAQNRVIGADDIRLYFITKEIGGLG